MTVKQQIRRQRQIFRDRAGRGGWRMKRVQRVFALLLVNVRLSRAETRGYQQVKQDNPQLVRQRDSLQSTDRFLAGHDNVFVRSHDATSRRTKSDKKMSRGKSAKEEQTLRSESPTPAPSINLVAQDLSTIKPSKGAKGCLAGPGKAGSKCEKADSTETASPTIAPTTAPTIMPTTSPTKAPTASPTKAPTSIPTMARISLPTLTPTIIRPSQGAVATVATTTTVSIEVDSLNGPSFQDIVDAASLFCDQISTQASAIVAQAAPLIVGRDIRCSILRDSNEDAILLEIDMAIDDSSIIIPGDSERAAILCFTITGQNAIPLLDQFVALPPSNGFAGARSIQCSLATDTNAPSVKPTPRPTMTRLTRFPTVSPIREPTKTPSAPPTTVSPTRAPTKLPSRPPTTVSPTRAPTTPPSPPPVPSPTKSPSLRPVVRPVAVPTTVPSLRPVTLAPTTTVSASSPTENPIVIQTKPPSLSPVATSLTASPVVSPPLPSASVPPTSGTIEIVQATQFSIDYSVSSIIALENQDFVAAAHVTCEHVHAELLRTFNTGFVTVPTFLCTPVQTSDSPLFIEYDILVAFNGAGPTTSDVDILVNTAFQQPVVVDLISDLQALGGVNPFTTTSSVLYRTS